MTSPYFTVDEMMVGDMVDSGGRKAEYIIKGTDEVNEKLGLRYVMPIDLTDVTIDQSTRSFIKRMAIFYGSGRYLMETDQSGEENGVHAYGLLLITEAEAAMQAIVIKKTVDLRDLTLKIGPNDERSKFRTIPTVSIWDDTDTFVGVAAQQFWGNDPRFTG